MSEESGLEQEAAHWVAHRLCGERFDAAGFEAWLAGDPARKAVFDAMWRRITGPDMDEALDAYARRSRRARWGKATAGAAAALCLAALTFRAALPAMDLARAPSRELTAPASVAREVTLEDGTQLTLAGGAQVQVRYTRHEREVTLVRGTLYAAVAHDPQRPFQVRAGEALIIDVGTSFEVSRRPSMIQVAVETGTVTFGARGGLGGRIDLTAGQAAVLSRDGVRRAPDERPGEVARWRAGWADYRDAPLSRVIADLAAFSLLPLEIASPDLADSRISGRIRLTDPEETLRNLALVHHFSIQRQPDALTLAR